MAYKAGERVVVMEKTFIIFWAIVFTIGSISFGKVYTDNFDSDNDYLINGVTSTIWDGFIFNSGHDSTQNTIVESAVSNNGILTLQSSRGNWENAADDGLLLYIDIAAGTDFTASVYVNNYIWTDWHDAGLMVRTAESDSEDYVMSRYFANYGINNCMRSTDNNITTNDNGPSYPAMPYLQLQKTGSMFYIRASEDGINYINIASVDRQDMAGTALQVGIYQATFSDNTGTVAFDDFLLITTPTEKTAEYYLPSNGAIDLQKTVTLAWNAGYGAVEHYLYAGNNYDSVLNANTESSEYITTLYGNDLTYTFESLAEGRTYFWRVDEYDGVETYAGEVWSFTTYKINNILDDFEAYSDSIELNSAWQCNDYSSVELNSVSPTINNGLKSMKISYANPVGSQGRIVHTLSEPAMWNANGIEALAIYVYGQANNDILPISLGVSTDSWGSDLVTIPMNVDQVNIQSEKWQRWDIDLNSFRSSNPAIDLDEITNISVFIGDKLNTSTKNGTIYIDPILVYGQRCMGEIDPLADIDNDCKVDILDLTEMAQNWLEITDFGDINSNNYVDIEDMTELAKEWHGSYDLWPQKPNGRVMLSVVEIENVEVTGGIWKQRQNTVENTTVWDVFGQCESTGRIENFYVAAGLHSGSFQGMRYDDSDVFKAMEGAAYILRKNPDNTALRNYMDTLIDVMEMAQEDDGYLNTYGTLTSYVRWSNMDDHELYCAGHMFEAAVEYFITTGDRQFLDMAIRYADLIDNVFGPGKNMYPPGHQEIELALVKLYKVTNVVRYLDLAKFFIDQRGNSAGHSLYGEYSQDHLPFIYQNEAVGHSVRQEYMCIGAADIAMVNQDQSYFDSLNNQWDSVTKFKQYITGGIGHYHHSEGYSSNYDLPNDLAYCETCASIANVMWNQRMFYIYADGKYGDMMEKALYNGVLSGLSLDGGRYYYTNPLDAYGAVRPEWYGTACCPPNLLRMVADIGAYAFGQKSDSLYINLYMQANGTFSTTNGDVSLDMVTHYPWAGAVNITVSPEVSSVFDLYLRIPGWARNQPFPTDLYRYLDETQPVWTLTVNGEKVDYEMEKGFARISRQWHSGDIVKLDLPMSVQKVVANPEVSADDGLVALMRGPVVYCFETHDVPSGVLEHLLVSDDDNFTAEYSDDMLNLSGVESPGVVLNGTVQAAYVNESNEIVYQDESIRGIPYYAWMHRGQTHMRVWLARDESKVSPVPSPVYKMLGYWKLNETNGTTAYNSSSDNNSTAQCGGGLSFDNNSIAGIEGQALSFDGSDDYIEIEDGTSNFGAGVTVSVWAYPTAVKSWSRLFDLGNSSSQDNIVFGTLGNSNDLFFEIYNGTSSGGQIIVDDAIQLDQWQMYTATCDNSGNAKVYINGQLKKSGITASPQTLQRVNNYIGRSNWNGDAYYHGYMDDIRIYSYPLSDQQVYDLYNLAN